MNVTGVVDVLQLYETLFEIPFFEYTTALYKQQAQQLREASDCCTFMWRVSLRVSLSDYLQK